MKEEPDECELAAAQIFRPLGQAPLTRKQAALAGQLLGLHCSSVYRLRRRFLEDPVTASLLRLRQDHGEGNTCCRNKWRQSFRMSYPIGFRGRSISRIPLMRFVERFTCGAPLHAPHQFHGQRYPAGGPTTVTKKA